jgi:lipid II:glycine glycyltransferase (peptidoglycan interpeptide bridge formation enzyme)
LPNKEPYKQFCAQRADVPLFLQPWWLDVVCADWDVALAKKGDDITGVWPYPIEKKMGVPMIRTPRMTPYLGPYIFFPKDLKASNVDGYEHEVLTELVQQLPDAKVWHLAMQPGFKQVGILKAKGLKQQVQQTFLIDLAADEATLFANMKENMRRNIKAAEKEITITEDKGCLKELYEFSTATLSAKGKANTFSLNELKKLFDACTANNAGTLYVAKKEDQVAAVIWNAWDEKNSYYLMGAQNPATDNYKAMSALLWHAIKAAKQIGCETFDLEGSMDPGVERFFRGFGGRRELYMVLLKNDSLTWKVKQLLRP